MKNFVIDKRMISSTDGYFDVVVEGEIHSNRVRISSGIQYFTTEGGYSYNHPWQTAKENAEAIANGLNLLEQSKNPNEKKPVAPPVENKIYQACERIQNSLFHNTKDLLADFANQMKNIHDTSLNRMDRDERIRDLCLKTGLAEIHLSGKFY